MEGITGPARAAPIWMYGLRSSPTYCDGKNRLITSLPEKMSIGYRVRLFWFTSSNRSTDYQERHQLLKSILDLPTEARWSTHSVASVMRQVYGAIRTAALHKLAGVHTKESSTVTGVQDGLRQILIESREVNEAHQKTGSLEFEDRFD